MKNVKRISVIPIVIPVYNPPVQFEPFVRSLQSVSTSPIIIVNDGSDTVFRSIFRSLGMHPSTTILHHKINKGKGAALKTAIHYSLANHHPMGIITADADGQHVVKDILACIQLARNQRDALIIGTRVDRASMPIRSRTGNAFTRTFLRLLHKFYVRDTQSGLRYVPKELMKLSLGSIFDKYDFELDMIIRAVQQNISIIEFPIETIYLNRNKASHYKIVKDSVHVARVFVHHLGK